YFERVIPLPETVKEDDIRCDFRNGVLAIHVPKAAEPQRGSRRIPVQDADRIPSETASGRNRTQGELRMTGEAGDEAEERELAGAKGGETSSESRPAGKTGGAD